MILSLVPYEQQILGAGSRDTVDFTSAFLELEHGVRLSTSLCVLRVHVLQLLGALSLYDSAFREQLTLLHAPLELPWPSCT